MDAINKKTIYIKNDDLEIWEEIEKIAADNNRGVGYYICELWRKCKAGRLRTALNEEKKDVF